MATKPANHKSYRTKADKIFMAQFHNRHCEICNSSYGVVGHHIIPKSRSRALRYDVRNIICLCPRHHTMGNDMAPHSSNQLAVGRFIEWFKLSKPEQYAWTVENEHIQRKYSYRQAVENLKAGRKAWE